MSHVKEQYLISRRSISNFWKDASSPNAKNLEVGDLNVLLNTHMGSHTHALTNDLLSVFDQQLLGDRSKLFDGLSGLRN